MATSRPVILLAGADELLLHRALERLLDELRADRPDLDVELVEGHEASGLPELRTGSLFGGARCVVIRGFDALSSAVTDEVVAYLEQPDPDATLVLVGGTDKRQRIPKRAAEVGERLEVQVPKPWDARAWERLASEELARLGREAEPAALRALLEHAGTDAAAIASKCAQVAAAVTDARVTVADVEAVVEGHGSRGGFPVADAIAERDPAAAVVALTGALESGEEPLAILGAVTYRVRQLLQVRGGRSHQQLAMSSGQYKRLQGLARRFHPGELPWCHDRLARADLDLKGSDLPARLLLEVAIVDLATSREVGPPWLPAALGS